MTPEEAAATLLAMHPFRDREDFLAKAVAVIREAVGKSPIALAQPGAAFISEERLNDVLTAMCQFGREATTTEISRADDLRRGAPWAGLAYSSAYTALRVLESQGKVERLGGRPQRWRLTDAGRCGILEPLDIPSLKTGQGPG